MANDSNFPVVKDYDKIIGTLDQDYLFQVLRCQSVANFLCLLLGPIGIWSCGTTIFVYLAFAKDFKSKGYCLLACLAGANLSLVTGLATLGLLRLVQLFTNTLPSINMFACSCVMAPYFFGYTAGVAFDFVVALDQLIYVCRPHFYSVGLGKKYLILMVCLGLAPLLMEVPLFFVIDTSKKVELCSSYDPNMINSMRYVSDYVNLGMMLCTFGLYALVAYRSRHFVLTAAAQSIRAIRVPHEINTLVTKFVLMQRRLVRVSVFTAFSFLLTACTSMILKMILSNYLEEDTLLVWVSYTALLQIFHGVNTIVIAYWRDDVFKRRLILVLRSCYLLRRPTVQAYGLEMSDTFFVCPL